MLSILQPWLCAEYCLNRHYGHSADSDAGNRQTCSFAGRQVIIIVVIHNQLLIGCLRVHPSPWRASLAHSADMPDLIPACVNAQSTLHTT